jgi:predicted MFS family arabinose efflux permease
VLVVLFAENGICRAIVESLSGAEAASLASPDEVGASLGALRFWKPIGIIAMALLGSRIAERYGLGAILIPLTIVQGLACVAALLIHETRPQTPATAGNNKIEPGHQLWLPRDARLWAFVAAMVLFHAANAPGGVYLGLFMKRDLHAPDRILPYAFIVSMTAWMLCVWPAGWAADRFGRKPLLILGWVVMSVRLLVVAMAHTSEQVLANQALDGFANGLFAVLAAAWVTDRLADPRRLGEAQVIVGTSLVLGSAVGPAIAGLVVDALGYRGLFAALAAVGALATGVVIALVPETRPRHAELAPSDRVEPMGTLSDLSTSP